MTIKINELDKISFLLKLKFKFGSDVLHKIINLNQVLPINSGISYCAYISDLTLVVNKQQYEIENFDTLFGLLEIIKSRRGLEDIRRQYQIYEGDHLLDEQMKNVLRKISGDSKHLFIKCAEDRNTVHYWETDLSEFLQLHSFLNELPINWGEFDFFDEGNNWFIKVNEDDPFIFLAAKDLIIRQICEQYPNKFIQVDGTMSYL